MNVYYSVIPDKNYFLAEANGYPSLDYEAFINKLNSSVKDMTYINIFDTLTIDDFYTTDTHWKQENIDEVVNRLGESMGLLPYYERLMESGEYSSVNEMCNQLGLNYDDVYEDDLADDDDYDYDY